LSPFERTLRDLIALQGPVSVERYMSLALTYYYGTRDPLGARGDFTTAPEISQMFGELIGLWAVETWTLMGSPGAVRLVELGPGRGTLMSDALRAARLVPAFGEAASVHLVETSPVLRRAQEKALSGVAAVTWHDTIEDVPEGPALIIANEFFDALPVRQFVATDRGWCERLVGLDAERLAFGLRAEPQTLPVPGTIGDVLEVPETSIATASRIGKRLTSEGGAALLFDYGYWGPAFGDTLQALRHNVYADPLDQPGDADLTTHVDFHHLAAAAQPALFHGPVSQGDFLETLGIGARAEALGRRASLEQAAKISTALARLTDRSPTGMGTLFKVLALSHPAVTNLPGLPPGQKLEG
jgi:SAM-dependent MidA family methyltransferase